jgi:hypothetical protein
MHEAVYTEKRHETINIIIIFIACKELYNNN